MILFELPPICSNHNQDSGCISGNSLTMFSLSSDRNQILVVVVEEAIVVEIKPEPTVAGRSIIV